MILVFFMNHPLFKIVLSFFSTLCLMHYALITQTYQKPFVYTSMSFIHDLFYPEKILFYTDYISFPTIVFKFLFTGLSFTFLLYKVQILSKSFSIHGKHIYFTSYLPSPNHENLWLTFYSMIDLLLIRCFIVIPLELKTLRFILLYFISNT